MDIITREGFYIGTFLVRWYGVIIMFGAVMAAVLSERECKRRGVNPDYVWDMMPWLLIAGIIGARIWHILTPPASMVEAGYTTQYYLTHPLDMINVRNGGLGIPGAIMGGALACWIYCRIKKVNFAMFVDIVAPGLALAQAIGRWGNFMNQEVYGAPSTLPWAIYIDEAHRLPEFMSYSTYHPLFLYESIWNLLNMALLLILARKAAKWLKDGNLFWIYVMVYAAARFALEYLRLDPSPVAGFNVNQTLMAVLFVIGALFLVITHLPSRKKTEPVVQE